MMAALLMCTLKW